MKEQAFFPQNPNHCIKHYLCKSRKLSSKMENKKQLIKMLAAALGNQHIEIKQPEGNDVVVTVQTALKKSQRVTQPL